MELEKGIKLYELKRYDEALAVLLACLQEAKGSPYPLKYISLCYFYKRNYNTSQHYITEYISKNPEDAYGYYLSGYVNYYLKNYTESEKQVSQALAVDPEFADAHGLMGFLMQKKQNREKAANYAKAGLAIDPNNINCLTVLSLLSTESTVDNRVSQLINKDPENYIIFYNSGVSHEKNRNFAKAIDFYKESLRLNPNYHPTKEAIKRCLFFEKQLDRKQDIFRPLQTVVSILLVVAFVINFQSLGPYWLIVGVFWSFFIFYPSLSMVILQTSSSIRVLSSSNRIFYTTKDKITAFFSILLFLSLAGGLIAFFITADFTLFYVLSLILITFPFILIKISLNKFNNILKVSVTAIFLAAIVCHWFKDVYNIYPTLLIFGSASFLWSVAVISKKRNNGN